jgi:hypothetical protein
MADAVTTQVLIDTPQTLVIKLTNFSDGTGESAVVKVDPANYGGSTNFKLMGIWYSTVTMNVRLLWDATTPVTLMNLPANYAEDMCFDKFGGIQNDGGSGVTGKIKLTTIGHAANAAYTIILRLKKV